MTPVLILEHISLFRGVRTILSNISLTINPGEHWAILGPNGSGKTTRMNIITAYVWPMEGTVTVTAQLTFARNAVISVWYHPPCSNVFHSVRQ